MADATWPNSRFVDARRAIFGVFFCEAFVLGHWITRIPDVKTLFDFSKTELGVALFIFAVGTLIAFSSGANLVKRASLRRMCIFAGVGYPICNLLLPHMSGWIMLAPLLIAGGISIGLLEVSMNTAADRLERESGRRLMSAAHGSWSLGSLVGAIIGSGFASADISVAVHFGLMMPLAAALAAIAAFRVPDWPSDRRSSESAGASVIQLPRRGLVLLCIMPIGIMLVEGAFIDWSALHVRSELQGGAQASGLIFAAFATVMAITRFSGDHLLERYGDVRVAQVSAVCATLGIAMFSLAPNVEFAFLGALLSGLGVAIVYPLTMTAVARRAGDPEDNVAAAALFSFTAFMLAPPIIGALADWWSLSAALALLIPFAASSLLLTGQLKRRD